MEARIQDARLRGAHAARLAAGVLAASLAVACTSATPTERATSAPTGAPTGGPPSELRVTDGALPAGRYVASGFKPEITVALDGTWQAFNLLDGFFDLGHSSEPQDATLVQFARVDAVVAGTNSTHPAPLGPDAALDTIKSNASLRVIETSTSRMSGLVGSQVTVEPEPASNDSPVLMASGSPVVVEEGRRLWIAFFDTPDGLLAIMVSGTIDHWDAALAAAEPILESVTIRSTP